ncbi:MAG: membrane protein insertase YidC [Candidatus Babeliales bacterium]
MNRKDLLVLLSLSLLITWGMQFYFSRYEVVSEEVQSGQRFNAPQHLQVHRPLNVEVDFIDDKPATKHEITAIDTDLAHYEFTTDGAAVSRVQFKRKWSDNSFETIFPATQYDREKSAFLVAFDQETPFYYQLEGVKDLGDTYQVAYKAPFNGGVIRKIFTVFKESYRFDLALSLEFNTGSRTIRPRVFIPSPILAELREDKAEGKKSTDLISGIVNDGLSKVQIVPKNDQAIESYWANPSLFGSQDRYFVHAFVHDQHNFAQRGFYKAVDFESMYAIIEGPEVEKNSTWNLSFYVGPKEDDAMTAVDSRLDQTLNYGWLSFISKPLSRILLEVLNFLYNYVHNYGLAIILLTILIKLLMFPFTYKSEGGMKKQVEYEKKMEYIKNRYKNDPEALNRARAEYIEKHGLPGMGGVLSGFLQLPIFWALSTTLSNAIELYRAPFLWIPDLSARDPYYIFPLIMVIGVIFYNPTSDPSKRITSLILAVIFAAFISNFAAGITLYFAVNTLLGIVQSFVVKKFKLV